MDRTEARKRWAMLALIFATRVGLGFQFQTMGSVADAVAGRLDLSSAEIGTLIGLFLVPGLALSIPAGFAGRYASDRLLVALGMASLALGGVLGAMADGFAVPFVPILAAIAMFGLTIVTYAFFRIAQRVTR